VGGWWVPVRVFRIPKRQRTIANVIYKIDQVVYVDQQEIVVIVFGGFPGLRDNIYEVRFSMFFVDPTEDSFQQ